MKALRDEVIVAPEELAEKIGSILLVYDEDHMPTGPIPAEIVAIGPDVADPDIRVGQRVYFHSRNKVSTAFEFRGRKLARILASDIDAVIER